MFIIYFIIILLLMYFFYLLLKYSGTEKPKFSLSYFRDSEYIKYPPIIVGYLNSKKIKEEHFIATALDFVTKGYIKLEKNEDNLDYIFTIIKDIKTSEIEMEALTIFFNDYPKIGIKQSLQQFKKIMKMEKKFGNYTKLKRTFNTKIREYFDKKQDIKKITKSANIKNIFISYLLFVIVCYTLSFLNTNSSIVQPFIVSTVTFILFVITVSFVKYSLLGNFTWILPILVTCIFTQTLVVLLDTIGVNNNLIIILFILIIMAIIILFDDMLQRKKTNLANAYEMIKALKRYIIDYSNINEYDIYQIYLWNEYYVYAVSLDVKKI